MVNKLYQYFVIILLVGFISNNTIFAQKNDVKNYKMLYKFNTVKQHDNSRLLEVSFVANNKKDRKIKLPVYGADINFINIADEEEILLGTVKTDNEGFARLTLPENQTYYTDSEGYINFLARFENTNALKLIEKQLAIKDVFLELNFVEIDSIKKVILNAYSLDSLKAKIPLEGTPIIFSVGGFISNLPIKEATIEDGEFEFEFPEDIPGDIEGNIDVFVSIENHDDYGNVVQKNNVPWGIFQKQTNKPTFTLWSHYAPIWMYVVLTILLVGVWSNYIYSIINLFRIKKEGENLELEGEN
jgi:hypothetical protein